jgi:hypothetical protein
MVAGKFHFEVIAWNMKILMLVYNPLTNDLRVYNEAKSLIQAGHEVTVITFGGENKTLKDKSGEVKQDV